jgi:hypothetical protein
LRLPAHGIERKKHSEDRAATALLLTASGAQGAVMAIDNLAAYPETEWPDFGGPWLAMKA